MSIALMAAVWEVGLPISRKMTLLAMADWANDAGGSLYPSISKVAKRVSCSERQAQRIIHELVKQGWLSVVGNLTGGAPGASRRYQINVEKLGTGGTSATRSRKSRTPKATGTGDKLSRVTSATETGDICDARGVTSTTETGDMGVTLSVIDPSLEPTIETSSRDDGDVPKTEAEWVQVFEVDHGVLVDPRSVHDRRKFWPLARAWIAAGVTVGQMRRAGAKARAEASEPIAYLPAYADRVLAAITRERAPPAEPAWRRENRARIQQAVPGIAAQAPGPAVIDVEAKHVPASTLG